MPRNATAAREGATPAGLAALLARRGYRLAGETLVMVGPAAGEADSEALLSPAPDDSFAAVFVGAGGWALGQPDLNGHGTHSGQRGVDFAVFERQELCALHFVQT